MALRDSYARYPRSILWLVPGGLLGEVEVAPFYLSKWPITNEQFEAFDPGYQRAEVSPDDRGPAVGVTYDQALGYCEWYAGVSRKPIRLPTEVEWEYACRGGAPGGCTGSAEDIDARAWHLGNADGRHSPADSKRGNGFGLHGMLGGVWEWVGSEAVGEPEAVVRGGSIRVAANELSCAMRKVVRRGWRADDAGFRIVKPFGRA